MEYLFADAGFISLNRDEASRYVHRRCRLLKGAFPIGGIRVPDPRDRVSPVQWSWSRWNIVRLVDPRYETNRRVANRGLRVTHAVASVCLLTGSFYLAGNVMKREFINRLIEYHRGGKWIWNTLIWYVFKLIFFFFGKKYCNEFRIIQYDVRKEISSWIS